MIVSTPSGLFCGPGNFYIDPWEPVERALVTHAHSDHARPGSAGYLCAAPGEALLRRRIPDGRIETLPYGTPMTIGAARVSFHPAGHILGSAQIRVEHRGEVWVVSGDYKRQADPTCVPFEPVTCHTFTGLRARIRGHRPLHPAQERPRRPFSTHAAVAERQTGS